MVYELREYHCVPGRLPDLIQRFQAQTTVLWRELGIRPIAFFTTVIGPSSTRLTYLLEWDSLAERELRWNGFLNDARWLAIRAETEAQGPLIDFVENRILSACVMVPRFNAN